MIVRLGHTSSDSHLLMNIVPNKIADLRTDLNYYQSLKPSNVIPVFSGFSAMHEKFRTHAKKFETVGVREHYQWWAENHRSVDSGKLLFILPKTLTKNAKNMAKASVNKEFKEENHVNDVFPIFFDDHGDCVDVRCLGTGKSLRTARHTKLFEDIHLHWVFPLDAVGDGQYFIDQVKKSIKAGGLSFTGSEDFVERVQSAPCKKMKI